MAVKSKKDKMEEEKVKKIERLLKAIEEVYPSNKRLIYKSFLRGIFIGLGTTIGVSIVLAVMTYAIGQLKLVPVISDFITEYNFGEVLEEE